MEEGRGVWPQGENNRKPLYSTSLSFWPVRLFLTSFLLYVNSLLYEVKNVNTFFS